MERVQAGKFNEANHDYYRLSMKSIKRSMLLSPFTEFIGVIAGVIVLFFEGRDVIAGKISFGALGVSLAALMSMIRPFKKLSQLNSIFQQAIAGSERVNKVLETVPTVLEKQNPRELTGFNKEIQFDHVWFSYGHVPVIKDIHLTVKHGEIIAIVGSSGAGKSTLVDLIPRFYDPEKGAVLLDGINIREFSFKSLRDHIALVTQETILFNDSVAANIAFGMQSASQKQIEDAAKQAHIHDVITRLPKGYETFIGERGIKMSGGERQRLAIARALLKNAPILILDEATSQLDTESERLVQDALNLLMQGRTVFMIAHRLSTIRDADRILVMDAGQIAEQGTHESLIAANVLYKKLCMNQQIEM
jgi:subfamily B ATP-binding cassette protein MsbA